MLIDPPVTNISGGFLEEDWRDRRRPYIRVVIHAQRREDIKAFTIETSLHRNTVEDYLVFNAVAERLANEGLEKLQSGSDRPGDIRAYWNDQATK